MIRAPSNCDLSFCICKCCLLPQIAENRPTRMPVHSEMLGHAICMRLALYCSPLGHSLFLPRDIVVTLHRMRAHTTLWSFLMPHCTPGVSPRVATPCEMNMHFLPVSPGPKVLPIPEYPFSESSIQTVLIQSAKNPDFFRQRNQTPQARYRSWGSLKMKLLYFVFQLNTQHTHPGFTQTHTPRFLRTPDVDWGSLGSKNGLGK